jgi:hypothetical protein
MKINVQKLLSVIEKKTNKGIEKLDTLKMYTEDYHNLLDSIMMNIEAAKKIEEYDVECQDCKETTQADPQPSNAPILNPNNNLPTQRQPSSAIGKKYVPFKNGGKNNGK